MAEISVRPGFCFMLSLMILVLPLPWVCALLISSTVHEFAHLAALKLSGVRVHSIVLQSSGAVLETGDMTPLQGMISAIAGPLVPLMLIFMARWMPRTALCALIQGFYHLLPVRPLDGGRALENLAAYLGWDTRICSAAEWLTVPALLYLGITAVLLDFGLLPVILCVSVITRVVYEKFLANRLGNEYNRCTKP